MPKLVHFYIILFLLETSLMRAVYVVPFVAAHEDDGK